MSPSLLILIGVGVLAAVKMRPQSTSPPGIINPTPTSSGRVIVTWPSPKNITHFSRFAAIADQLRALGASVPADAAFGAVWNQATWTLTVPSGKEAEVAAVINASGAASASVDRARTATS